MDVKDQFFIFDEQRLVGNGKWTKAFLKIAKKNRWILLSATPGDTWMDYIPVMIANGFYRNRTEFKREHVIYAPFSKYPKVERYVNVQRLVRQRNQILIHMPYPKETKRHPVNVWCEFDEITMARVSHGRWNIFEDKPIRDIADLFHQMRKVTNTDPSRLGAVWKLLEEHPRLIIFYNFDYELTILRTLKESETDYAYAEWNGHKHQAIPETDKWIYVLQVHWHSPKAGTARPPMRCASGALPTRTSCGSRPMAVLIGSTLRTKIFTTTPCAPRQRLIGPSGGR